MTPKTIKSNCSDAELNLAMAPFSGWIWHGDLSWPRDPEAFYWKHSEGQRSYRNLPSFATDANAVLPLLEKFVYVDINRDADFEKGPWSVALGVRLSVDSELWIAVAPTFARSACFALLKAQGWIVSEEAKS